ncbi:MAG TPA: hypothetical protein VJ797_15705 [Burkholderiales bacterium]|nr:hypothetical protein [Burkholderiales bacterium]
MIPGAARITQRDTVYRIEDPLTGLCIRLHSVPVAGAAAPRIVPELQPAKLSTWFATHAQAAEAFARFLGVAPYDIVRSDA